MKRRYFLWTAVAVGIGACSTEHCPDSGSGLGSTCGQTSDSAAAAAVAAGSGSLIVSLSASLLRFAGASSLQGNVVPAATVRGTLTRLSGARQLFLDSPRGRLVVPNGGDNSILFFENPASFSENTAPKNYIVGPNSRLNSPVQAVVDGTGQQLFVANAGDNSILVFSLASLGQGDLAPTRVLSGAATGLTGITSLALDGNNRLLVASSSGAVLVFDSASTINGAVPPSGQLKGGNTKLATPSTLLLSGSRLYVGQSGGWLRFDSLPSTAGDLAPTAAVTGLGRVVQMALGSSDQMFVLDDSSVSVFEGASSANGAPLPSRRLQGSNTQLSAAAGLALL